MLVMGVMASRDQRTRLPWLPYLGEVRLQQQRFMVDHLVKVCACTEGRQAGRDE